MVDSNGDGIEEPHPVSINGDIQPLTSLIVKFNGEHWVDELGRVWDDQVKFNLPDRDVFTIDANAEVPVLVSGGDYKGVGTVLFNMVANPVNGKVYVANTEARNHVRFEGPGGPGITSVRGHIAESRISVLGDTVTAIHLNKHIDYNQCCAPMPQVQEKTLAFPMDMAVSSDGKSLYVAAFGSGKVGIFDTAKLEDNSFIPNANDHIVLSGGGPTGLALDEANGRLYVLTRFDNAISVVDLASRTEKAHIPLFNPEPESVIVGRPFLYDANLSSSNGENACASCHIFGDMDNLAWDLGNPFATAVNNPGPLKINHEEFGIPANPDFQAMKGPMTTQSLRGMANHGAMHWRGDRTGGNDEPSVQPDGGTFNEEAAFKAFNVAFPGLNGRDVPLTDAQMQAFTDFALQITYPPNPIRALDNSLTPVQQAGSDFFFDDTKIVDSKFYCGGCHDVDRQANATAGVLKPGFFGTDGSNTFAFQPQFFKVPHLRNMYQKVGMFGMANSSFFLADNPFNPDPFFGVENPHLGDQVRGFGFFHDGSADTVFRFHNVLGFLPRPPGTVTPQDPGNPANLPITAEGMEIRKNLEEFLMVFDSNLYPIVGQQVTLHPVNLGTSAQRVDLLLAQADLGRCDVVLTRKSGGRAYLYMGNGKLQADLSTEALINESDVRSRVSTDGETLTYTCVPPENGTRLALDRDEDGYYNADELAAGSDPANAQSIPL